MTYLASFLKAETLVMENYCPQTKNYKLPPKKGILHNLSESNIRKPKISKREKSTDVCLNQGG